MTRKKEAAAAARVKDIEEEKEHPRALNMSKKFLAVTVCMCEFYKDRLQFLKAYLDTVGYRVAENFVGSPLHHFCFFPHTNVR